MLISGCGRAYSRAYCTSFFSLFSKGEKFRSLLLVRSTANQRHFRGGNFNTRLTRPLIIAPPLPPTLHSAQWGAAQPNPSHSDKLDQIRFYVTNFARSHLISLL